MASQRLQQPQQSPQASSDPSAKYLAFIRPTALSADRVDRVSSELQPSVRIAAINATMAKVDGAWQERLNLSERNNQARLATKEAEHQSTLAALEAENRSLTARLAHEEWSDLEQILNEDLRSAREENTKLWARQRNYISSKKRADLRIKNDAARIDALQKEVSDLKHYDASLTKDIRDLLAKHP